jgi:hydrogenase nickel incorporation protein HypA/HybF
VHEISLVRNIFRTLEERFPPAELARITSIRLQVGLLSNVEPVLLQNAYDAVTATDRPAFRDVALDVELVPVEVSCPACQAITAVEQYRFRCAACGTPTNQIVRGTELLISGVEMQDTEAVDKTT